MMKSALTAFATRHPRLARGSGSASARLVSHETAGQPSGCPRKAGMTGFLIIVIALFSLAIPAHAEVSPQGALMVANVAGECEVLYSMVEFQKRSTVKGGEEYVAKFWAAEAEKLGMSVEQLSDRCNRSTTAFDKLWSSATSRGPAVGNE